MLENYLAKNLKQLRLYHEYTQEQLGQMLHMSRSSYAHYEQGVRFPSLENILFLANLYNITLDDLVMRPVTEVKEKRPQGYTLITPVNSRITLTGADAKAIMDYKHFPQKDQEDVRQYIRFKKHELESRQ